MCYNINVKSERKENKMLKVYSVRIQNPDTKEIPKVAIIVQASNAMQAIHKARVAKKDDRYLDPLLLVKCKEI